MKLRGVLRVVEDRSDDVVTSTGIDRCAVSLSFTKPVNTVNGGAGRLATPTS
jgi:hypothetical protein